MQSKSAVILLTMLETFNLITMCQSNSATEEDHSVNAMYNEKNHHSSRERPSAVFNFDIGRQSDG